MNIYRKYTVFYVGILLLISSLMSTNFILADEFTNFKGVIINGSAVDKEQTYSIRLLAIQDTASDLIEIEKTETTKLFEFKNVLINTNLTYFLMVDYQGVPAVFFIDDIEDFNNIELIVYERSFLPESIEVMDYSIMIPHISPDSNIISVLGLISLNNISTSTFMADLSDPNLSGLNLLRFSLPEKFENLSVDSDLPPGNVMQIPTGFALSNPIPPGDHQILYSYSMPYNTKSIKYVIKLPFGAENFKLLAPGKTSFSKPDNLELNSTNVDGKVYEVLKASNIQKGESISLEVINIPVPGAVSKITFFIKQNVIAITVVSVSGFFLIVLILISLFKNYSNKLSSDQNLKKENNRLIDKIIELDEKYRNKKVEKEDYEILRSGLKDKIKGKI